MSIKIAASTTCPDGFPTLEVSTDNRSFTFLRTVDLSELRDAFRDVFHDGYNKGYMHGGDFVIDQIRAARSTND